MGLAVIAVVFVAGLIGVPSLFGHSDAHAQPQQAVASTQASAQVASVDTPATTDTTTQASLADHP